MKCKRCDEDESRVHGFCSVECEDKWYLEEEIKELKEQRDALAEQVKGHNSFSVPLNCDQNRCHLCRGTGFIDEPKNKVRCYECKDEK